jgi:hypothetical protein
MRSLPAISVTVSSGSGNASFGVNYNNDKDRRLLGIIPPSGSPTFSYYIIDNLTGVQIDAQQGVTSPQVFVSNPGTMPFCNNMTIFIYSATINGTWKVVPYVGNA